MCLIKLYTFTFLTQFERNLIGKSNYEVDQNDTLCTDKKHEEVWIVHLFIYLFLASPDAQEVMWVTQSLSHWSGLADLTDDTFRRLGTWVTHDYLSSVIESVRPS